MAAFRRQLIPSTPNLVDTPLTILQSREDYNRIALKTMTTVPEFLWYDPAYPLGVIYPWPVPSSAYEIHMTVLRELPAFASANVTITLPEEYESALLWNLTKRIRIAYRRPVDISINMQARNSLNVLAQANMAIPQLTMPSGIPAKNNSRFNIYTGQPT